MTRPDLPTGPESDRAPNLTAHARLLAKALEKLLGHPGQGAMAFVRCLPRPVVLELCRDPSFKIGGWVVYGVTDALGFVGPVAHDVKVITNKVTWKSLRVGFAGNLALTERMRLDLDLALVPYSKVRNDDSHFLRQDPTDLGPAPNIIIEGEGRGVQLDAELRYEIVRRTDLGLGVRFWYLEANKATMTVEALGSDSIDGQRARKFLIRNTQPHPSESTIWISDEGYPLKMEIAGQGNENVRMVVRYSRFNDPAIRIDPP